MRLINKFIKHDESFFKHRNQVLSLDYYNYRMNLTFINQTYQDIIDFVKFL